MDSDYLDEGGEPIDHGVQHLCSSMYSICLIPVAGSRRRASRPTRWGKLRWPYLGAGLNSLVNAGTHGNEATDILVNATGEVRLGSPRLN